MPIVFVHGVAARGEGFQRTWTHVESYLRHYVAPALSPDAGQVAIVPAYWGDIASAPRFGGASRPRTPLVGLGAQDGAAPPAAARPPLWSAAEFAALLPAGPQSSPLVASGPATAQGGALRGFRELSPDELSDLAVTCASPAGARAPAPEWLVAADEVAHDPEVLRKLRQARDDAAAESLYMNEVERRVTSLGGLAAMGAREWRQRIAEAIHRGSHAPGFAVSRVLGEARGPVNAAATRFLGDVFVYLNNRIENGQIGPIPRLVLDNLRDAGQRRLSPGEPLVVVTHSMGGQIVYDLVTYFLPRHPPGADGQPRIDFWCATASQVGLFLDLNLFLAADAGAAPLPRPPARWLGGWWNVWDYNDFLSFSVKDIVEGVDDEAYSSGLSLVSAHSGYLQRPSFYRRLRGKLDDAAKRDWDRAPGGGGP